MAPVRVPVDFKSGEGFGLMSNSFEDLTGSGSSGEIDLLQFARKVAAHRGTIIRGIVVGLIISVLYLHLATYEYTSVLMLVPTEQGGTSSVGDLAGRLGGLVPSLGKLSASKSISPFVEYPEAINTREVAQDFVEHSPQLVREIFYRQWDSRTKQWKNPSSGLHLGHALQMMIGLPVRAWRPPGAAELQEFIKLRVSLSQDVEKPIMRLSFTWKDPRIAREFLQELNNATDRVLRRMYLSRSLKYAGFLEGKLDHENRDYIREVLTDALSTQETMIMMGNSDTSFAAQTIGDATLPEVPSSPDPILVLLMGAVGGFVLGVIMIYYRLHIFDQVKNALLKRFSTTKFGSWGNKSANL